MRITLPLGIDFFGHVIHWSEIFPHPLAAHHRSTHAPATSQRVFMSSVLCGVCPVVVRASAPGAPRSPLTTSAPFPIHSGDVRRRGVHLGSTSGRGSSTVRMALPKEAVDAGFVAADAEVPTFAAQSMSDALEGTGVEPWQLWFGLWIGLSPFVIAAYEFGKRILIQRQCELCSGSGLIQKGRYARKCTSCGGFLPWQSWGQFFTSEAGNGGVVRVPKGQTSVFYDVEAARLEGQRQAKAAREAEEAGEADIEVPDTNSG